MKYTFCRALVLIALILNYASAVAQKAIAKSSTEFSPDRAWNVLTDGISGTNNSGETLNVSASVIVTETYKTLDAYRRFGISEFATSLQSGQADEFDVASSYFGSMEVFYADMLPDGCLFQNSGTDGINIKFGVGRTKQYAIEQGWKFLGVKTSYGYIPFFKIADKSGTNSCMNLFRISYFKNLDKPKPAPVSHIMTDCNGVKREMGDTTTSPPGFYSKDRTVWVSADGHWSKITGNGLEDLCPTVTPAKAMVMETTCDPNITVVREDWKGAEGEVFYNSGMYMKKNSVWYKKSATGYYEELCPAYIASTPKKSECNNCVEMTPTYHTCYNESPCNSCNTMSRTYGCCNSGYQPYAYTPPPATFWQKASSFFFAISLNLQPANYTWNRMPTFYQGVPMWSGTPFDGGNPVYSIGNPFDGGQSVFTNSNPTSFDGGGRIAGVAQDWWH